MKPFLVTSTRQYVKIFELIEEFQIAAIKFCKRERKESVSVNIIDDVDLMYLKDNEQIRLEVKDMIHLEHVHKMGSIKEEMKDLVIPINIMNLYDKLDELITQKKMSLFHIEKSIMGLI